MCFLNEERSSQRGDLLERFYYIKIEKIANAFKFFKNNYKKKMWLILMNNRVSGHLVTFWDPPSVLVTYTSNKHYTTQTFF